MSLSTKPYKGTRDFYPEDMRVRKWMFDTWRQVCESFGYEEYDGPILEPFELYAAKTSEEIVNDQTYSFTDRGDRKVVMRPEMTPTVSRMVAARRQELSYPLRMYSIPNCFRYERPQRGRLREFWQLNVDLFGVEGAAAEIEMVVVIDQLMKAFGATESMYEIRVNSRQLLNERIEQAGIKTTQKDVMRLIDAYDKLTAEDFSARLVDNVNNPQILVDFLQGSDTDPRMSELLNNLTAAGTNTARFVPTIARGFDYYTDIVFEVFDLNPENNRAMFGGGRYDGLVGELGAEPVPTVGFGMGDVTFQNFLESNGLLKDLPSETDVSVVVIGDVLLKAQQLAQELRSAGLNIAVDLSGRKADKQIKSADKKGVKTVLFIGEQEVETGQFKLKNLATGQEQLLDVAGIIRELGK